MFDTRRISVLLHAGNTQTRKLDMWFQRISDIEKNGRVGGKQFVDN